MTSLKRHVPDIYIFGCSFFLALPQSHIPTRNLNVRPFPVGAYPASMGRRTCPLGVSFLALAHFRANNHGNDANSSGAGGIFLAAFGHVDCWRRLLRIAPSSGSYWSLTSRRVQFGACMLVPLWGAAATYQAINISGPPQPGPC